MPSFFYSQLVTSLPLLERDLTGQTIIVTGSNVGLGKEAARHFALMKPGKLIIAVRNTQKGEEAAKDIAETTGFRNIEVWSLDLASFDSVKKFAKRIASDLDRLDILLENAGLSNESWEETADGYEATLQVNVISTTLLALLALPKMRETVKKFKSQARIVIVGSEVHHWTPFIENESPRPVERLNDKSAFLVNDRYLVSKLLDLFITREIGNFLEGSKVTEDKSILINCVNPGLCHSELSRKAGWGLYILKLFLARSTSYGARNLVWAALASQENQGEYVSDCSFVEPSDFSISPAGLEGQKKVWNDLHKIFSSVAPEANSVF